MADGPVASPPLPRSSALAAIVGPREDLPPIYREPIERLARETIAENTRRALESDLRYLAAWKRVAVGEELAFPETDDVVARFILDHSADLEGMAPDDPPRLTADVLIDLGLRRSRAMPRPSTLERRLASWRRLHGVRNLAGPSGSPALRSLVARARAAGRAVRGHAAKKSANPVDREILDRLAAIALADTADFDTLFEIDDDAGPRLVRRRFRGAGAVAMRALIEADDVALIDDADTAPLAPPADWIASRDATLTRLGLTLDDLPF